MAETDRRSRLERFREDVIENGWTRERLLALFVVWSLVVPLLLPSFQVYLFTEFLLVALFATAFNLLYGYTGLLSFGHAMFYAAAGYGVALVLQDFASVVPAAGGASPLVTFLVGAVFGLVVVVVLAVPVGFLSVRLEEIYFALITLSFSMAFYAIALQDPYGLTQGSDGLLVLLGSVEVGGLDLSLLDRTVYYYVVLVVVLPSAYLLWRIVNSPFGTVCRAMRESPERAAALGVNVRFHQWVMFVVSAVFTGVAGAFVAPLYNVVSPDMAHWTTSAIPVIATVIGGAFYFLGPAVGAFVFLYLRWAISRFPALEAHWELVFGVVVILVLLFFKQGVAGGLDALGDWVGQLQTGDRKDGIDGAPESDRDADSPDGPVRESDTLGDSGPPTDDSADSRGDRP